MDAKELHDTLLAEKPEGASHEPCVLCETDPPAPTNRQTAEESKVGDTRTYSQQEHEAILTSAVEREVARASEDKDARIADLESKVDVLEAEKAAAVKDKEDLESEFEDFKNKADRDREIAERAAEREQTIKEIASHLGDDYFTEERRKRWAEMADEQFADLVDVFADAAIERLDAEEAAQLEGLEGEERHDKLIELNEARATREAAQEAAEKGSVRETAAFGGGTTPTGRKGGSGGGSGPTTLSRLFKLPTNA